MIERGLPTLRISRSCSVGRSASIASATLLSISKRWRGVVSDHASNAAGRGRDRVVDVGRVARRDLVEPRAGRGLEHLVGRAAAGRAPRPADEVVACHRRILRAAGANGLDDATGRANGHDVPMVAPGQVVVLNGTSSAGKTSLAEAFQELRAAAGECWVVFGIDDFMAKLPRRVDRRSTRGPVRRRPTACGSTRRRPRALPDRRARSPAACRLPPVDRRDRARRPQRGRRRGDASRSTSGRSGGPRSRDSTAVWVALRCDVEVAVAAGSGARRSRAAGSSAARPRSCTASRSTTSSSTRTATRADDLARPARPRISERPDGRRVMSAAMGAARRIRTVRRAPDWPEPPPVRLTVRGTLRRTFGSLDTPQLPPLLRRRPRLPRRRLDADDGRGLAGADSSRGSGAAVGATFAFRFLPVLLFGLWGGVIADRFDRRKVLLVTQIARRRCSRSCCG